MVSSTMYTLLSLAIVAKNKYSQISTKDEKQIESQQEHYGTSEVINFEIDDYHLQRLKELGLDGVDEDDTNQYISRI